MSTFKSCSRLFSMLILYFPVYWILIRFDKGWDDEFFSMMISSSGVDLVLSFKDIFLGIAILIVSGDIRNATVATDEAINKEAYCIGLLAVFGLIFFIVPAATEATYGLVYLLFAVEVVVNMIIIGKVSRHDIMIGR